MIDWVSLKAKCRHNPDVLLSGRSIRTKIVDGIEHLQYELLNRLVVEGSYSSVITIRSHTDGTIEISGNPAKFLQGHNVFGTNDLVYLVAKLFERLFQIKELELSPTDFERELIRNGDYRLTRVDVNEHFLFPSEQLAKAWLRAAGRSATLKYRGSGIYKDGTMYFTPQSRRSVSLIYHKGDEITSRDKKHRLADELLLIPELLDYAKRSLRFELRTFSTQLNDLGLALGCNWKKDTASALMYDHFISKLQLSANMSLSHSVIENLPKNLRLTYTAWINGEDLRQVLSRPTFYRYRTEFLKFGIDISIVQELEKEISNVVPMIRYLEAMPMGIPAWAYEKNLVA
jgi:II/X family phage/plasmid replication protein